MIETENIRDWEFSETFHDKVHFAQLKCIEPSVILPSKSLSQKYRFLFNGAAWLSGLCMEFESCWYHELVLSLLVHSLTQRMFIANWSASCHLGFFIWWLYLSYLFTVYFQAKCICTINTSNLFSGLIWKPRSYKITFNAFGRVAKVPHIDQQRRNHLIWTFRFVQ